MYENNNNRNEPFIKSDICITPLQGTVDCFVMEQSTLYRATFMRSLFQFHTMFSKLWHNSREKKNFHDQTIWNASVCIFFLLSGIEFVGSIKGSEQKKWVSVDVNVEAATVAGKKLRKVRMMKVRYSTWSDRCNWFWWLRYIINPSNVSIIFYLILKN